MEEPIHNGLLPFLPQLLSPHRARSSYSRSHSYSKCFYCNLRSLIGFWHSYAPLHRKVRLTCHSFILEGFTNFGSLYADSILQSELMSAPALTQSTGAGQQCSGCYIVADVAGVVFGNEVINQTVSTAVVSVVVGLNGTTTTTSFIAGETQFTFNPTGIVGTGPAGLGSTAFDFGSTIITVSGATLSV